MNFEHHKTIFNQNGFEIIENIYTKEEVNNIIIAIESADNEKDTFRKSSDLFAIRQFLKEIPKTTQLIFNDKLRKVINQVLGDDYFVVKSIYFDKPETSNWFVPYHQDLTISVDKKTEIPNFRGWTVKQQQFAVQPPIEILENIATIRIHLDNTDENNGALKLIPKSHLKQLYNPKLINREQQTEINCCVNKGGIMLMKPLVLHSSNKTLNNQRRRVIHIEFSNMALPSPLNWSERLNLNQNGV